MSDLLANSELEPPQQVGRVRQLQLLGWRIQLGHRTATPNHSLNPRLATAGVVSPVRASRSIIAVRAYATCLRSRG